MNDHMLGKILIALGLFALVQMVIFWSRMAEMSDNKMSLEAEVDMLTRKRDNLLLKNSELEREQHR